MRRGWVRPAILVGLVVAGNIAARALGLGEAIKLGNLARLKQGIESYGALAPGIFIVGYVLAAVLFVPGLPITVLGGVAFGPVWGTVYVWIAATIGAGLAFLVARYAVRSTVEGWVAGSPRLARIDGQVAEHGWRIVMLTRLVPIFPFNLQNYAYGITRIGFWPYAITSSICMLPGTAAFTFAGAALSDGRGDVKRTLAYLAVAGVLLVLISLIPRWLQRRSRLAGELLKTGIVTALLAATLPAQAAADDAYARLLQAHVRPGVVNGVRLNLVDYRAVKAERPDVQLALVGSMAHDDPEGWDYYSRTVAYSSGDPDIYILSNLNNVGSVEVNAFQVHSAAVIQKSIKEGFGLTVTESLWKTRPTVAGRVGGIITQIQDGETGWLVESSTECAQACIEILRDSQEARQRALRGKEYVRRHFLMPRLLRDWLVLMNTLLGNDTSGAEIPVVAAV